MENSLVSTTNTTKSSFPIEELSNYIQFIPHPLLIAKIEKIDIIANRGYSEFYATGKKTSKELTLEEVIALLNHCCTMCSNGHRANIYVDLRPMCGQCVLDIVPTKDTTIWHLHMKLTPRKIFTEILLLKEIIPYVIVGLKYNPKKQNFQMKVTGPDTEDVFTERHELLSTEEVAPLQEESTVSIHDALSMLNELCFTCNGIGGNYVFEWDIAVKHSSHPFSGHRPICNYCAKEHNFDRRTLICMKGIKNFQEVIKYAPVREAMHNMHSLP